MGTAVADQPRDHHSHKFADIRKQLDTLRAQVAEHERTTKGPARAHWGRIMRNLEEAADSCTTAESRQYPVED